MMQPAAGAADGATRRWSRPPAVFGGPSGVFCPPPRGRDHAIVEDINRRYDMSGHLRCDAGHVNAMDDAFVDRFGIAGSPAYCAERLQELVGLGLDHLVLVGPGPDVAISDVADAWMLLGTEVMPALKSARPHPP